MSILRSSPRSPRAILLGVTAMVSLPLLLPIAGCTNDAPAVASSADSVGTFDEFRARTYREPWLHGNYIVEGDIPVRDDEALREYWASLQPGQLVVGTDGGDDVKWSPTAKLNLRYCVSNNFGASMTRVIEAMEGAAREWEARANVNFIHVPSQDGGNCHAFNNNVVFNIRQVDVGGQYAASAFFPDWPRAQRELKINVGSLAAYDPNTGNGQPGFGLIQLLGHELGHVLGFRHEHTRPEAGGGDCFEDNDWRALTPYDDQSIMHYCNGVTNWHWWSPKDRDGSAGLYAVGNRAKADILWRQTSTGAVSFWLMNGGTMVGQGGSPVAAGWNIIGHGDLNRDYKADLIWRHNDGTVSVWLMSGVNYAGGYGLGVKAAPWTLEAVADVDGDDRSELVWRNGAALEIWFLAGNGSVVASIRGPVEGAGTGVPVPNGRAIVGSGDFDGNGTADLLWGPAQALGQPNDVLVWLMNSNRVVARAVPATDTTGGVHHSIGDFNGDLRDDLLRRRANGTLEMWFMNGVTRTAITAPPSPTSEWTLVGAADFNADWKTDLFWRNTAGTLGIWYMEGGVHIGDGFPPSPVSSDWVIRGFPHLD